MKIGPLWLRLLLRRLRSPEGRLALLAALSISVSVTLATGLEMASRSAQAQLEQTSAAISGAAEIEIVAGNVGLPESVLELARSTPGVLAASPLVSVKLRIADSDFALNVLGVDLLAEELVRTTSIEQAGLQVRDPLRLLATPDSVVATEQLLRNLGLIEQYRTGGRAELRVRFGGETRTLVVRGLLRPTGIAAAFSGQVAVMDVYAAQEFGRRTGLLDRVDVVPAIGQDVNELISRLSASLEGVATVRPSSARGRAGENLLAMVRKGALMLAGIAALVASLLTYATTAQWVERQRRQLATLRAVGMEARRVQRMVFLEVVVLSSIGSVFGILGGIAISPPLLATISGFLRVANVEKLSGISVQASTLWLAVGVGLVAGAVGSLVPAIRAGRRFSLDALDTESRGIGGRNPALLLGISAGVAFVFLLVADPEHFMGGAMLRVGLLFVAGPLSILGLVPSSLRLMPRCLNEFERVTPALSHLITRFYRARPVTFSVSVTSIALLLGALVTVFLLIATISAAWDQWTESRYPKGATLISAAPIAGWTSSDLITREAVEIIRETPGVEAASEQYTAGSSIIFQGLEVHMFARTMRVEATHGHINSIGIRSNDLATELAKGSIAVSPGFARTFGVSPGESVDLDTPKGARTYRVAGIFEDFGEESGTIMLDLATFDQTWQRSGASSLKVWFSEDPELTKESIRRRVGPIQDLYFASADEVVVANRAFTGAFTSTLRVLSVFISLLGGIGVAILLGGIVAERRRDLAVIRAAGAEPKQIKALILADAAVLGLLGCVFGVALGFACAVPAADIMRQSYGWILEQNWFAVELPYLIAGALATAILGALFPARLAARTTASEMFGPE